MRAPSSMLPVELLFLLFVAGIATETSANAASPHDLPGGVERSAALESRLNAALREERSTAPRTRHLDESGRPLYVNRLLLEDSPYLRQHAHNPIDWFPWSAEAFARARELDRPVFVSIGYSTCHWCHVMEHESFEDLDVAALLNRDFVSIKVDREQRPDVDDVYMTALMLLNRGSGGWPMTLLMDAEGRPFFGGTYLPREPFLDLLQQASAAWTGNREAITSTGSRVSERLQEIHALSEVEGSLDDEVFARALDQLYRSVDAEHGGFGSGPKFPRETDLFFLLDHYTRTGEREALETAVAALRAMARGGIHDHAGGGFHRYTVDREWRIPHFEKMLYNQALLGQAYLSATRWTGDPELARVARRTLDAVLRDFQDPDGGFYSATDADSGHGEGEFFVWNPAALSEVLGPEKGRWAAEILGVTSEGNFEGQTVLHLPRPLSEVATAQGKPLRSLHAELDEVLDQLREAREARPAPLRDEKILVAWNGMTIRTLVLGAEILGDPEYLEAAVLAGERLWNAAHSSQRGWHRILFEGRPSIPGMLDDHAFMIEAFLALADATGDDEWVARAETTMAEMLGRFSDEATGAFHVALPRAGEPLPARSRAARDQAVPSAPAAALRALVALAARSGDPELEARARRGFASLAGNVDRAPAAYTTVLRGLLELRNGAAGSRAWGASGKVHLAGRVEGDHLHLSLDVAPGWHVSAPDPGDADLLPMTLRLGDASPRELDSVRWPSPVPLEATWTQGEVRVLEGSVEISAALRSKQEGTPPSTGVLRPSLTIQACDDRRCLAPETLVLEVPIHATHHP